MTSNGPGSYRQDMSLITPKLHLPPHAAPALAVGITEIARLAWGALLIVASAVCIVVGQGTGPERPPLFPRPTTEARDAGG